MVKKISALLIFLCWLLFLFCTHLICFDIYNSSPWYCYVLSCVAALFQYTLLLVLNRNGNTTPLIYICFVIYGCLSLSKIIQIIAYQAYGLWVLCGFLDLCGSVLTLRIAVRSRGIQ